MNQQEALHVELVCMVLSYCFQILGWESSVFVIFFWRVGNERNYSTFKSGEQNSLFESLNAKSLD